MSWLLVFGSVAVADWVWARYIAAIAARKRWMAGFYSALVVALGGILTLALIEDRRFLAPACAGAFIGTVLAVGRE